MSKVLWISQSFLISIAIFFVFEVEVAFNHTGSAGWQCFKVTATSVERSKDSRNGEAAHCCKVNKTARWHIVFGILSILQTSLLFMFHMLRIRSSASSIISLHIVSTTSWALALIKLSTKLIEHFSSKISSSRTTVGDGHISTSFARISHAIAYVLSAAFKQVSNFIMRPRYPPSVNQNRDTSQNQDLKDGWHFCMSELNSQSLEQAGVNVSRVFLVLLAAYVISSGYTLYLVLLHEERREETLITGDKSTGIPVQYDESDFRQGNDFHVDDGDKQKKKAEKKIVASLNTPCELDKEITVAFMEEQSDEESFVFGWRL